MFKQWEIDVAYSMQTGRQTDTQTGGQNHLSQLAKLRKCATAKAFDDWAKEHVSLLLSLSDLREST